MADSEDDLPESISFSTSKSQAIKDFQANVKQLLKTKRSGKKRDNIDEPPPKQTPQKKEKKLKIHSEESEPCKKKSKSRVIKTGNTVFEIEAIDDNVTKAQNISEKAIAFRRNQLFGNRIKREPAKNVLNKRIKRQVANRKLT